MLASSPFASVSGFSEPSTRPLTKFNVASIACRQASGFRSGLGGSRGTCEVACTASCVKIWYLFSLTSASWRFRRVFSSSKLFIRSLRRSIYSWKPCNSMDSIRLSRSSSSARRPPPFSTMTMILPSPRQPLEKQVVESLRDSVLSRPPSSPKHGNQSPTPGLGTR